MLLRPTAELPAGESWSYELKLDGFRAVAFKTDGGVHLRSLNNKDFNRKYPSIVRALAAMPDDTVIDGEVMALDEVGRPSFNALQNYTPGAAPLVYYAFDVMILGASAGPGEGRRADPRIARTGRQPARPDRHGEGAQLGGAGCEATRQPVRAWPAFRRVAEDARQPRPGVRHRRLRLARTASTLSSSVATTATG